MEWISIAYLTEMGTYSGRYLDTESGYYNPVLIEIKDGDTIITFWNGQTIDNPDEEKTDFLDESQLSEGGEEKTLTAKECADIVVQWRNRDMDHWQPIVDHRDKLLEENESIKQHNLKLTECLGELVELVEEFEPESGFFHVDKAKITKAKSLIRLQ